MQQAREIWFQITQLEFTTQPRRKMEKSPKWPSLFCVHEIWRKARENTVVTMSHCSGILLLRVWSKCVDLFARNRRVHLNNQTKQIQVTETCVWVFHLFNEIISAVISVVLRLVFTSHVILRMKWNSIKVKRANNISRTFFSVIFYFFKEGDLTVFWRGMGSPQS